MNFAASIKRHPIMTYYALVFAISWGGFLVLIGPSAIPGIIAQTGRPWSIVLVTLVGPCVAGVLSTILVHGRGGLRDLASRLVRWRVDVRWYAVALLTAPLTVFATLLGLSAFSPAFLPGILTTGDKLSLLVYALVAGLVVSFCEELGWTGFAIPEVGRRYSILGTGLFVGFFWAAWHILSNLWGVGGLTGSLPLPLFLIPFFFSWLPPYRVLMVWVYDHTKSVSVGMMMHGSLDFFWLISMPTGIAGVNMVTWYIAWAAVLWIIAGIVVFKENRARTQIATIGAQLIEEKASVR